LAMCISGAPAVRHQILGEARGQTRLGINGEILRGVAIPLPPITEQSLIMEEVDSHLSVITATANYIAASLKRASRLRQSILKEAFAGRLVPQNPNDKPADILLARICSHTLSIHSPANRPRPERQVIRHREPKEIVMRRGSLTCYIVNRLHPNPSFGRTQLVKALHLTQSHVGVDLELAFERHPMGPLDTRVYKVEGFAEKQGWFSTTNRRRLGVTYHPGPNIDERCRDAIDILAGKRAEMDRLLTHFATMNTDHAELFSTLFAAWNDLLIDGQPTDDAAIVAEVYAWHESKRKFGRDEVLARIAWMRDNGYVPTGAGSRTQALPDMDAGSAE
jgi:hypothetical protein